MDPGAAAHYYLAWTLCIQGFAEQGKDMLERAQGIACVLPQVSARANMHLICALCRRMCTRCRGGKANAEASLNWPPSIGLPRTRSYASNLLGWVAMESGRPAEAGWRPMSERIARPLGGGAPATPSSSDLAGDRACSGGPS